MGERGEAGAEVVDGDHDAEVPEVLDDLLEIGRENSEMMLVSVLLARAAARKAAYFKCAIDLGCGTGLAAGAFAKESIALSASTCRRA